MLFDVVCHLLLFGASISLSGLEVLKTTSTTQKSTFSLQTPSYSNGCSRNPDVIVTKVSSFSPKKVPQQVLRYFVLPLLQD